MTSAHHRIPPAPYRLHWTTAAALVIVWGGSVAVCVAAGLAGARLFGVAWRR